MGDETGREVARLEVLVTDLLAEVQRLAGEVEQLKGEPSAGVVAPGTPPTVVRNVADGAPAGPLTRRAVLLGGAGAAVGAVALVAAAGPAAAVNGNLVLGTTNSSNPSTVVAAAGGTFGFGVVDSAFGGSVASELPTILGHAVGTTYLTGVYGLYNGSATTGVGVNGKSGPGIGVKASTTSGTGVQATASTGTGLSATSSSGVGLKANSSNSLAIDAVSQSNHAVRGESKGIHSGILGISTSTATTSDAAVLGVGAQGGGVHGRATTGFGVLGWSDTVAGVRGTVGTTAPAVEGVNTKSTNDAGPGVLGSSQNGDGVQGVSGTVLRAGVSGSSTQPAGIGVRGFSQDGTGVKAETGTGHGLDAASIDGNAVNATSTNGIALLALGIGNTAAVVSSDRAQLVLTPASPPTRLAPITDGFAHATGELLVDGAGDLWYCSAAGTPGTWRQLAGTATSGALHVLPAPTRVYDSRPFTSPAGGSKTPLAANTARSLDLKNNASGVPADALGVLVNVLLLNATAGSGNFTIWANGVPRPSGNTMVWGGSDARFTAFALTGVDATGLCQVFASLKTDLAIDVVGFFR